MPEATELAAVRTAAGVLAQARETLGDAEWGLARAITNAKEAGIDPARVHDAAGMTRSQVARLQAATADRGES